MDELPVWIAKFVKNCIKPTKKIKIIYFFLIMILFIVSFTLVYYTGGTKYVYAHIVYIPILFSAFLFRIPGGIIAGIISGIILGPLMPLEVEMGIMQSSSNWIIRMIFLVFSGLTAGVFFHILSSQFLKIEKQAYYNSVVELPNELKLQKKIEEIINFEKEINSFAVVNLTIENYLDILNIVGQDNSESLLRKIRDHIQSFLSKDITLYISSNNEFEILLLEYKKEDAIKWVQNFSNYLNNLTDFNDIPIHLKTHIGLALCSKNEKNAQKVIRNSFIAMDKARKKGLKFSIYNNTSLEKFKDKFNLLGEVKKALEDDDFVLHYQPKIDLETEKIVGVEALIRWNHHDRGFIPPNEFIPEVERTDLINQLTYWVLERAINDYKEWNSKNVDLNIAVNISARNLKTHNFIDEIDHIFKNNSVDMSKIELELTERDLMSDTSHMNSILNQLKERNFMISMDDFGTGYSSLAYLKYLPTEIIKIDRAFIKNITTNEKDREITSIAIKIGHTLGKKVVAEGVESKEEINLLKKMGCDYAQGYYLSKPKPKDEIEKLYFS